MKTVRNKTHKPLAVPLPRGKKLHLSPLKTGQIASDDADHPAVKKLLEAGEIEIVGEESGPADGGGVGGAKKASPGAPGHSSGISRRSGDR
jgi:hypothetical protein